MAQSAFERAKEKAARRAVVAAEREAARLEAEGKKRDEANTARRKREAEKRALTEIIGENEPEPVKPTALGVRPQAIPGSALPKRMKDARQNLTEAFDLMGGVPALVRWGRKQPTEFYRIWARLIPKDVADATGALPLEDLLSKLAARSEQSVLEAAAEIGEEVLATAREKVNMEDAASAFAQTEGKRTLQ